MQTYYAGSFLSETLTGAHLSPKPVGELLGEIGMVRERIKMVLKPLVSGTDFALVDLAHVLSRSKGVVSSVPGFNSKRHFSPPTIKSIRYKTKFLPLIAFQLS